MDQTDTLASDLNQTDATSETSSRTARKRDEAIAEKSYEESNSMVTVEDSEKETTVMDKTDTSGSDLSQTCALSEPFSGTTKVTTEMDQTDTAASEPNQTDVASQLNQTDATSDSSSSTARETELLKKQGLEKYKRRHGPRQKSLL